MMDATALVIPFLTSTVGGSIIAVIGLRVLERADIVKTGRPIGPMADLMSEQN